MQFLSVAAASSSGLAGLATMSNYFFIAAVCLLIVMTLVYLWYTIGSARLAKNVAVAQAKARSQKRSQASKAGKAAVAAAGDSGGVTTLVKSDVVMREQTDGEKPIAQIL